MRTNSFTTTSPSRRELLERTAAGGAAIALRGGIAGTLTGAWGASWPAGCPAPNHAVIGEKASLHVWLTPEIANLPAYQKAVMLFQQAYPGISVHVTPVPKDDILTKYKITIAGGGAGVAPDLISCHGYILGAQGLAHESDALWSAYGRGSNFRS